MCRTYGTTPSFPKSRTRNKSKSAARDFDTNRGPRFLFAFVYAAFAAGFSRAGGAVRSGGASSAAHSTGAI